MANNAEGYFTGKTVELGANIAVTRMAGDSDHKFTGTFDGNGKTLTVNYANTDDNDMTAPFSYVDGATIQNLIVSGSITGTANRAAGIVGETGINLSHITNCVSSVTISGNCNIGGLSIGGNVAIEGCVFNGTINGSSQSGGFVGSSQSTLSITNSLFAPQNGSSINGGTFYYNGDGNITPTNSYYTTALGSAQGKQAHSIKAGDSYVTVANAGTATTYSVSGITSYGTGIKYNNVLYAGSGDAVSLTFGAVDDAPTGNFSGYTASAGTLSGSTLTMPDEDVTISAVLAPIVSTYYIDANGTRQDVTATVLMGSDQASITTLGSDGTETWYVVKNSKEGVDAAYVYKIKCRGNVIIILEDGAEMTVNHSNSDGAICGSSNNTIPTVDPGTIPIVVSGTIPIVISGTVTNIAICGQTLGTGMLSITGTNCYSIYINGELAICGGTVNAIANGSNAIMASGTVTISGGKVTATGGEYGIYSTNGNITLGWTRATDFIKANSYSVPNGTVSVAPGLAFLTDDNPAQRVSGTISDMSLIDGKTLVPSTTVDITMNDAGIRTYASAAPLDFSSYTSTTEGATLTAYYASAFDEQASTLTMTETATTPSGAGLMLKGTPGAKFTLRTKACTALENDNLLVGLTEATEVAQQQTIQGVNYITFILANGGDEGINWYKLAEDCYMLKANSAYLRLSSDVAPSASRALTMVFEDEMTGLKEMVHGTSSNGTSNGVWYDLSGRRLVGKPMKHGVYMSDGRRVVIK